MGEDRPRRRGRRAEDPERALGGLAGPGPTQVSGVAAMRARDAARPTAEDEARAQEEVVTVRRHWQPPQ